MTFRYLNIDPNQPHVSRKHDCVGSVSFTDLFDAKSVREALAEIERVRAQILALPPHDVFQTRELPDGVWGFEVYVPSADGAEWDHSLSYRSVSGSSVAF